MISPEYIYTSLTLWSSYLGEICLAKLKIFWLTSFRGLVKTEKILTRVSSEETSVKTFQCRQISLKLTLFLLHCYWHQVHQSYRHLIDILTNCLTFDSHINSQLQFYSLRYKSKTVIFMYIQVYVYSCKQLQMKWSLTSHRSDLIFFGFLGIELPVISFESGLSVPVCSRSSEAISSNAEGIGGTRLNIVAHKNLLSVLQKVGVESTLVFW